MSLTQTRPLTTSRVEHSGPSGMLERPLTPALILSAFFVVTIPLCVLYHRDPTLLSRWSPALAYLLVLGMTHFVITLTIYFSSDNRRHFASTPGNRLVYYAIPLGLLLVFDLYGAFQVALLLPLFDLILQGVLRLFDFQHFTRQNYGVLQLFKASRHVRFPAWSRQAEHYYFIVLTLFLFTTFLTGGHIRPERPLVRVMAVLSVGMLFWVLAGYVQVWRSSGSARTIAAPLGYLGVQSASAALAIVDTRLYAFALATHYVEYHALMAPRCFRTPLDESKPLDRTLAWLRRRPGLFYAALVILAVPVTQFAWRSMGQLLFSGEPAMHVSTRAFIGVFNGLFVVHYVLESRIWRFNDPYYRQQLAPLYLGASTGPSPVDDGEAAPAESDPDAPQNWK